MGPFTNEWIASMKSNSAPFVPITMDAQIAAYNYISTSLGYSNGIRKAYNTILSVNLQTLYDKVAAFPCVDGPEWYASDMQYVVNALLPELTAAAMVADFFAKIDSNFFIGLFATEIVTTDEITSGLGLSDAPSSQNVGLLIANVVLGIAESLISALPGVGKAGYAVGSLIAGLIATTVQGVEAGITWTNPQPPPAGDVAINEFWATIASNIKALSLNLGDIQGQVCSDWGMMQWVSVQTQNEGPLDLNLTMIGQFTSAANNAFFNYGLQTLLPINYCIFQAYASEKTGGTSKPEYAYLDGFNSKGVAVSTTSNLKFGANTPLLYTDSSTMTSRGLNYPYAVWWIALKTNSTSFLDSPALFSQLNGISDVFLGLNGWNLVLTCYNYLNGMMVRVSNNTGSDFTLSDVGTPGSYLMLGNTSGTLAAGETMSWLSGDNSLIQATFTATFTDTNGSYLDVEATMDYGMTQGGQLSVLSGGNSANYYNNVQVVEPTYGGNFGGGGVLWVITPQNTTS
jgi:hypothetical protein